VKGEVGYVPQHESSMDATQEVTDGAGAGNLARAAANMDPHHEDSRAKRALRQAQKTLDTQNPGGVKSWLLGILVAGVAFGSMLIARSYVNKVIPGPLGPRPTEPPGPDIKKQIW
jgi:hypothetical protein